MTKINRPDECRALIIGGSLGGLFAGNLLRQIGWDVDIFERSAHDLDSRGGGIVLQPEVIELFRRVGVEIRTIDLGVRSKYRTVFWPDGSIQFKHFAPQTQIEIPQRSSLPAHFGVLSFVSGSMEGAGSAHTGLDAQHAVGAACCQARSTNSATLF